MSIDFDSFACNYSPTVAMQFSLNAISCFFVSWTTTWPSNFRTIVPNVPAARIVWFNRPGYCSMQWTRVPICRAPSGYASPSFALTAIELILVSGNWKSFLKILTRNSRNNSWRFYNIAGFHILRRNNVFQFIATSNQCNFCCSMTIEQNFDNSFFTRWPFSRSITFILNPMEFVFYPSTNTFGCLWNQ